MRQFNRATALIGSMRFRICAIVRGEAFHIKEWLSFHRLAARFWLACNDPDPQPLLQLLDAHIQPGLVAVRHVPS